MQQDLWQLDIAYVDVKYDTLPVPVFFFFCTEAPTRLPNTVISEMLKLC